MYDILYDPPNEPYHGFWTISVEGDNYIIEIIDIQSERLDEVSWSILNLNRLVTNWDDPSGETLRMEGDMIDILWNQSEYDTAEIKLDGRFYSRETIGNDSRNHTLCIVYMDVNTDGKFNNWDVIWIRSNENDGAADEDFRLRIVGEHGWYGEKILPAD